MGFSFDFNCHPMKLLHEWVVSNLFAGHDAAQEPQGGLRAEM
jgi:hypothetical protein